MVNSLRNEHAEPAVRANGHVCHASCCAGAAPALAVAHLKRSAKTMKRLGTYLALLVITAGLCRAAYSPRLVYVLEQLRHCRLAVGDETPMVGGRAVGAAGAPHEFYLLFPYVSRVAQEADIVAMLHDKSPVVRIMGVKCVLNRRWIQVPKPDLDPLLADKTEVFIADVGCEIHKRKVGEIVANLKAAPDFLGD